MKPQRISINAIVKLANLALDGIIALVVVSYFVRRLGPEAYGIVPWLTSLFVFFTIIPTAVQTAAGRFLTYALGRRNTAEASQYFSTSFFLFAGLGILGFLVTGVLAWLGSGIFPFKPEHVPDARALTLLLGSAVSLDIARGPLSLGYFARQRFDIEFGVMMASGVLRLALILVLSELLGISLLWIGVGALAGAVLRMAGGLYFIKRLLPEVMPSWRTISARLFRPLAIFALEVLLAGVGLVILNQADILVAGWLLGPAAVTVYFCGAKWSLLLRAVIGSCTTVLVPQVTTLQAEGKLDLILQLARRANRLVMPLGWLIAGLLLAFSRPLILTWVGPEQATAIDILRVIALPMAIAVSAYVALSVLTGIGKIRESSLSALAIGLVNPVLSVFLVLQLGMGVVGIALASAGCLVARNGIYIPLLIRRHAGLPLWNYYRQMAYSALAAVPSFVAGFLAAEHLNLIGWAKLIPAAIVCSLPSLAVLVFIIARPEDRKLLKSLLPFFQPETADSEGRV